MAQSAAARLGRRTVVAVAVLAVVSGATAQIAQAAPPANDNFGAATVISTAPTTVVGTNAEATRQTNEPTNGEQTVWWRWTAPDSGRYRLDLCQTTPEWAAVLSVYTGTAVA